MPAVQVCEVCGSTAHGDFPATNRRKTRRPLLTALDMLINRNLFPRNAVLAYARRPA